MARASAVIERAAQMLRQAAIDPIDAPAFLLAAGAAFDQVSPEQLHAIDSPLARSSYRRALLAAADSIDEESVASTRATS